MKVVVDTSTMVSALLWSGIPHRVLVEAEHGMYSLYTSPALIEELSGVLARPKFISRLTMLKITVDELMIGYIKLAHLILPVPIAPVIREDPDDDAVLACAVAAGASHIISSDAHLLTLHRFQSIHIVSPHVFVHSVLS